MHDDDGPISEVGEWALDKHARLERYVDISRAVRRMFIGRAGATYIELFSGPGRSKVKSTGQLIMGSPVAAVSKAIEVNAPFTDVYLADSNAEFVAAAATRVKALGARVYPVVGPAEVTVHRIADRLSEFGLHFAFLDPFALDPLPFTIIERLAKLEHMDILIHFSVYDLQRRLHVYLDESNDVLDRVAPGWRAKVQVGAPDDVVRAQILDHWLELIRGLGMITAKGIPLVSGTQNQRLYWLVFVARHALATDFWDKIRSISPQRELPLFQD